MKRHLLTVALLVAIGPCLTPMAEAQSVYPVLFDTPDPRAITGVQAEGAFSISTGLHYQKWVALSANGTAVPDSIFRVAAGFADTIVTMRVIAVGRESSSAVASSYQALYSMRIGDDTSSPANLWSHASDGNLSFSWLVSFPNFDEWTLQIDTNRELLTLFIEVFANKEVTFTELW